VTALELAKVTSKGQTTIPKKIRQALGIRRGDVLRFELHGDGATLSKVVYGEEAYLKALEGSMSEWLSEADEEAYGDL
jgi:AbrB family looped-hinge helix DNA binding protein